MKSAVEITTPTKITVLKHLANGRDRAFVAQVTGLPDEVVLDLASHHGYPDPDKMRWAIDVLTSDADQAALDGLPPATPQERWRQAPPETGRVHPAPAPANVPRLEQATPSAAPAPAPTFRQQLADLVRTAQVTGDKKIARLAARADDAVTALDQAVTTWTAAATERVAAAREAKAKAARIAKLEAELAQLKGSTGRRRTAAAAAGGPTAKLIRAWAAASGIECAPRGQVPRAVRDAYDAAHRDAA